MKWIPLELPRKLAEPSLCGSLMKPISRGDGLGALAVEARLRRLAVRGPYCHSESFSSKRVLDEDGDVKSITGLLHMIHMLFAESDCRGRPSRM